MDGRDEKNLKRRDNLGKLGVDGKINETQNSIQ
jgi:hypothetical protein